MQNIKKFGNTSDINLISLSRHPVNWFISKIHDREKHLTVKETREYYKKLLEKNINIVNFCFYQNQVLPYVLVELKYVFIQYIESKYQLNLKNYKIEELLDKNSNEFEKLLDISNNQIKLNSELKEKILPKKI